MKRSKPKKAAPAKRQAPVEPKPARVKKPDGEALYPTKYMVGILEDGTVVVVDSMGHAIQISPLTAQRIADLVVRTA